jgi:hypothetical protein
MYEKQVSTIGHWCGRQKKHSHGAISERPKKGANVSVISKQAAL